MAATTRIRRTGFFGGYQFNRNFAAEIGYAELGKATASGVVSGVPQSGNWKARSWDIVAVGIMPLSEQFSLLGKLGVALWRLDSTLTPTGIGSVQQSPTGTVCHLWPRRTVRLHATKSACAWNGRNTRTSETTQAVKKRRRRVQRRRALQVLTTA